MTRTRPQDRRHALEVGEIAAMLNQRVEELAFALLPNARRDGRHLCVGSVAGEPGQSLKIEVNGPRQGGWKDFSSPDADDGHGDMLKLIALVRFGGDIKAAILYAKSWLGLDHLDPGRLETVRAQAREASVAAAGRAAEEKAQKTRRAQGLWMGAKPIAGTPGEAYYRGRGIELHPERLDHWPGSLRFHPEVWHKDERCKIPAIVAMAVLPDGRHVATHRTFLSWNDRHGWVKLDSPNAKMVLGSIGGAFIPLRKGASGKSMRDMPDGELVHVTEGIEDGLVAAMARPARRIVAGYSLGNIGAIEWPDAVGPLVLLCDRDAKLRAVEQLERAIAKQQARGREVRFVMPPVGVKDLNEWLQQGLRDAARAQRA